MQRAACFRWKTHYLGKRHGRTISADACKATQQALLETKQSILFSSRRSRNPPHGRDAECGELPSTFSCGRFMGDGFAEQDAALNPAPEGSRKIVWPRPLPKQA